MLEQDACLHLLMPEWRVLAAWTQLQRALGDNDAVVLLASGCHLARLPALAGEAGRRPVYALAEELRAASAPAPDGASLRVIDWPELVELCADYELIRSWT